MACSIAGTMTSQSLSKENGKDPFLIRNEIAFNIQTLLLYSIVDNNNLLQTNFRWDIIYKQYFNKSGVRFGIKYRNQTDVFGNYSYFLRGDYNVFPSNTTITTATTVSSLSAHTWMNDIIGISGGYEYLMGKRKLKHFIGIDLNVAKVSVAEMTLRNTDSIQCSNPCYGHSVFVGSKNSYPIKLGLFPFYGIKYPLSNRLSISMQTEFEYYWLMGKINFAGENNTVYQAKAKQSGFHTESFISNMSVIYSF